MGLHRQFLKLCVKEQNSMVAFSGHFRNIVIAGEKSRQKTRQCDKPRAIIRQAQVENATGCGENTTEKLSYYRVKTVVVSYLCYRTILASCYRAIPLSWHLAIVLSSYPGILLLCYRGFVCCILHNLSQHQRDQLPCNRRHLADTCAKSQNNMAISGSKREAVQAILP